MSEVRKANKEAGFYFFEPATMRFFASRVASPLYKNQTFITSEKRCFEDYTRVYAVRKVSSNGDIKTVKSGFKSIDEARGYARLI